MAIILPPHFVQPVGEINQHELLIPKYFTDKLIGLESEARVRRSFTHRLWILSVIEFVDEDGHQRFKFTGNWEQFCYENEAVMGDCWLFSYSGNSVFTVSLFNHESIPKHLEERGPNPNEGRRRVRGRRPLYLDDSEYAIAASSFLAYSAYPHFLAVLSFSYMQTCTPTVTLSFASHYFGEEGDMPAWLFVKGNRYRVVFVTTFRDDRPCRCRIKEGFKEVIDGALISINSVLAFELVAQEPERVFKVTIFGR